MANNNDGQIVLGLDIPKTVNQINSDIKKLQNQLEQVKATGALDTNTTVKQINAQIASLQSQLKNIELKANINTGNITNQSQQVGQQIGNNIAQGVSSGVNKAKSELKSFSDLTNFSELNKKIHPLQIDPSELKNYQNILNSVKNTYSEFGQVKITNETFNNGILDKFKVNIEQVNGDLKETKSFMMSLTDDKDAFIFDGVIKGSESVVQHLDKTKNAINQTADAINNLQINNKADKIQLSYANGDYEAKVQSTIAKTQQWVNANGEARISTTSLSTALSNLDKAYLAITADGGNTVANQKALKQAESELSSEVKKVTNEVTKMNATMAKSSAVDALRQKYQMFYDTNTAAHRKWGKSLLSAISELAPGAEVSKQRIKELEQGLINTSNAARQAGKLGLSFFDTIKQGMSKFSYWTSSTFIIMKTVQEVKQMISNVEELDDALTNISYTMDVSNKQLEKIGNSSLEMAKDLHTSASNVLDAVKTYANANETAESILNKARATIMMSNVSGMGTDQTVDIIQGTVEQFDLSDTEEQLMHISDVLQTVSANMPMDFSKGLNELSEGIQTSGQTARQAGYDLESYSALLGTLISKTRQSGSELGRSLRTMMLRTTKASTTALASGEVTEDDLSNAEKALRRVGIEVRSDINTFKDFDQIIAELYGKLDTLSDVDMSNLAYELAGIRQSNVFKMMIASYGEYLDMAEKANNADGMTLTNQEKHAESLKGKITELSTIWEKIGDDAVSSSFLKGLTDVGIGVSSLIEKFGLLKTAIVGIGAYAGIKNVG